ncbi:MAG: TolC family protein, partial [Aureibaculum sp.]
YTQSLSDYLTIAAQNNPEVKATYAMFEAAMQKSPQVSSLPDPSITMSAFGQMIETRVGSQEARFSLMQMFPWFGTLSAKENAANLMAEAVFQNYLDTRNEVFFNLKRMYAELYELKKMIELEEENLSILTTYKELAITKFRNGKGAMVDVIRIDIKRNESLTNIQILKDRNYPLQVAFNSMLNRGVEDVINIPSSLLIESYQDAISDDNIFISNPKLVKLDKQKASFEAQKIVSKKEGLPMIGFGLDYSIISKRNVENLEMNGQDAIMPMMTVTLPIFRKKYKSAQKEVDFMLQANDYEQEAVKNNLVSTFKLAEFDLIKSGKLIDLYKDQTERTEQAIKLLLSAYSN